MQVFPFELIDENQFQMLCLELLVAEGCSQVLGGGTGPDQGKDVLVDVVYTSILGTEKRRFLVECKHKKSVGKNDFASARNALALHRVDGLLFITSGDFSGTVVTQANAQKQSKREPYAVELWNGLEFSRRLRKYPHIVRKYLFADRSVPLPSPIAYEQAELIKRYDLLPTESSVETYPTVPENEHVAAELAEYAKIFLESFPSITLLEGGIGSGKTRFGHSLLKLCRERSKSVATFKSSEFSSVFFSYQLEDENDYLLFCQLCEDVDVLFIDDLGYSDYFRDASYTQQLAAQEFCRLIRSRRVKQKPTIITISSEVKLGTTLRLYLEKLKREEKVLNLGSVNLFYYSAEDGRIREPNEWLTGFTDSETDKIEPLEGTNTISKPRHQTIYIMSDLAYEHLHERLEKIEVQVKELIRFVTTPVEEDEETRRKYREIWGHDHVSTRDEDIFGYLKSIAKLLKQYGEFYSRYSHKTENSSDN